MQGLDETFSKKIGSLSFQVRRTKILKYLEKKYSFFYLEKREYGERRSVMIAERRSQMGDWE